MSLDKGERQKIEKSVAGEIAEAYKKAESDPLANPESHPPVLGDAL
jgi:hypothetical protein